MVALTPRALKICAEMYQPLAARGFLEMERYTVSELEVILDFLRRARSVLEQRAGELRAATPASGEPAVP
jgi:hypothetical protein